MPEVVCEERDVCCGERNGDVSNVNVVFTRPFCVPRQALVLSNGVPPSGSTAGARAQHDAYIFGVDGKGGRRITHSHRIACRHGPSSVHGEQSDGHRWRFFWGHGLLHGMDGWKEGRGHGMNFVAWYGSVSFLVRNCLA